MDWYWYLFILAVAGACTALSSPLAFWLARRFDAIDYPDGKRVNTTPTPRLGGVMLFIGIFVSIGVFYLVSETFHSSIEIQSIINGINYFGVMLAVAVMFAVGLIDDFVSLKPLVKLAGQIVAAIIATASGVLLDHLANPFAVGFLEFGVFAYPITIFYLVAFANIINLIDGLDGLAAGISTISGAALLMLAMSKGGFDAVVFACALIGACLVFLFFNFHPARIFMGDSGALMLGFLLGLISLFGVVRTPALISLLVPVTIAGIPVLDTFFSIVRRVRAGQSIGERDIGHIHHRFINFGYDQRTTVLIMYALSALLAFCSVLIAEYTGVIRILFLLVLLAIAVILVWRLGLTESVLQHHYNRREPHSQHKEDDSGST
ncbi:MAG: undecaprenyl/decaprenyl-phosphate alpha-N-acetylglucosaminyl 1-phosphate transferase [Coriobacteriales bacterium]|nr:undecaprenyl/decaprenyl-phosphate alpha-N-acetylglucosaminyl 1-phosphate transferase [Coriobacteriales bacterium]